MAVGTHKASVLIALGAGLLLSGCDRTHDPRDEDEPPPAPLQATTEGGPRDERAQSLAERARRIPSSEKEKLDGIEAGAWAASAEGNDGAAETVELKDGEAKGRHRLALELKGGEKDFTAFKCEGAWSLKTKDKAATTVVIYNDTGGAMRFSVAYSFGKDYVWYESLPYELKAGWNTVRIDQTASDFKTRSSRWQHTAGFWMAEDCRAVSLVFHGGRRTGRFIVAYLGLGETGKR
ncbi:MAG: hypothetical protein KIS92_14685 [Planctomycetota bacterium]|nr:hypothetical protein [Planctomycetota bacterium]